MLKSLHSDPLTPKLGDIQCPALLTVGEKDPMGPKASEIVHDAMPAGRAELLRVPDKGHWLQLEAVEPVVAALDELARQVRSLGPSRPGEHDP